MVKIVLTIGAAILTAMLSGPAARADAPQRNVCPIDDSLIVDRSPLTTSAKALDGRRQLRILALGSMSTAGSGSSPAASWPARLAAALQPIYPQASIEVVNRGAKHLSAADVLARLDDEVKAAAPDLVIWESGVVDALRNSDPEEYSRVLIEGTDRLLSREIDLILMDAQFTKASNAFINFAPYTGAVKRVAEMRGLISFPRFELMRHWIGEDIFSFDGVPRSQQVFVVDGIYDCIARNLARMIVHGVAAARQEAPATRAGPP